MPSLSISLIKSTMASTFIWLSRMAKFPGEHQALASSKLTISPESSSPSKADNAAVPAIPPLMTLLFCSCSCLLTKYFLPFRLIAGSNVALGGSLDRNSDVSLYDIILLIFNHLASRSQCCKYIFDHCHTIHYRKVRLDTNVRCSKIDRCNH